MTEMARPVAIDRVGQAGLDIVVEAATDELVPLAGRLMIPAVTRLRCEFHLRRLPGSVIEATGALAGGVVQTCVVSLDDFPQAVEERFVVHFVPTGTECDDEDPESPDEIPYTGGAIDLGEAAAEQLALALDPYPRKPGVPEAADAPETGPHPFAALASLRRPQ